MARKRISMRLEALEANTDIAIVMEKKNGASKEVLNTTIKKSIVEYPCEKCNKKFTTTVGRKRHMKFCSVKENGVIEIDFFPFRCEFAEVPILDVQPAPAPAVAPDAVAPAPTVATATDHIHNPYQFEDDDPVKNTVSESVNSDLCPCCGVNKDIAHKSCYKCEICNKYYKFESNYKDHKKKLHSKSKKAIKCSMCPAMCADRQIFVLHKQSHLNKSQFPCSACKKSFTRKFDLERHLRQMGCDGRDTVKYRCEVCSAPFPRKDNLKAHLRNHLMEKKRFTCTICHVRFKTRSSLLVHCRTHTGFRPFECDHCGRGFASKISIQKHIRTHTGEKPYSCNECGWNFTNKEVLNRHMKRHTGVRPHVCNVCGASFIQAVQLRTHMFRHTGDSGNNCKHCGQAFPNKRALRLHEAFVHEGAEKIECVHPGCKKKFMTTYDMQKHQIVHTDVKPFKCNECCKTFRIRNSLLLHARTHLAERPRTCPVCRARACLRGDLLLRHLRNRHKDVYTEMLNEVRGAKKDSLYTVEKRREENQLLLAALDQVTEEQERGNHNTFLHQIMARLGKTPSTHSTDSPDLQSSQDEQLTHNNNDQMQVEEDIFTKCSEGPEQQTDMSEQELADKLEQLLQDLVDEDTLVCFGWPNKAVDEVLEDVIKQCGQQAADKSSMSRSSCLRENAKQLFLGVIEDDTIKRMMTTKSIDQVIQHIVDLSKS